MIAIAGAQGSLLKSVPELDSQDLGFHPAFGFIPEAALPQKVEARRLRGLPSPARDWAFRFRVEKQAEKLSVVALAGCSAEQVASSEWKLLTDRGEFRVLTQASVDPRVAAKPEDRDDSRRAMIISLLAGLALFGTLSQLNPRIEVAPEEIQEPITVKIQAEPQRHVVVPRTESMSQMPENQVQPSKEVKRAVQQDLGFLGLLGRKDLKKALGGAPTALQGASPGAGAGGKEGSGGEVLQGIGQGVKRITVGNSGVAGLGGVGTKGAGGGAGGYGNAMVGSGNGKGLTSIPISDDVVLEGGLDKSVIQATIAKYLSQVRACYEAGLRQVPGLTGQVSVSFEVNPQGALNFSRVSRSSLSNPGVEGCITERMMGWKFPKPVGGVNVRVNYPFLLRPVS